MARTPVTWDVENHDFWQSTGKPIAYRNLWISIPNLLCGFSVWLYWGMIAKIIVRIHQGNAELFDFTFGNAGQPYGDDIAGYAALLLTLPSVAGLVGATLRIPNSFMIAICGGRNVKFMTTLLLILPALGAGIALQNPRTSFSLLIVLAAMSGVGGGAFASSMSNISFFFPKRVQGLALGLNAGLGNAGVSIMQFLIPWVITFGLFGPLGGDPQQFVQQGESQRVWVQNGALIWVPIMSFLAVLAWLLMNNLPQHRCGSTSLAISRYLWLMLLGFAGGAVGVILLIMDWGGFPELVKIFVTMIVTVALTLALMRFFTPSETRHNLQRQFAILGNKHNWVMTWLYTMTFGSFIGYANAFPVLIDLVFGRIAVAPDGTLLASPIANPNAPVTANFIWIGAAVGALIRPVGGWLADKLGGARVTQWDTWIMVGATVLAGYFVYCARLSPAPETYFVPFLLTFVLLFATTGIGNGSTFRMIPIIFPKDQAGPVLGWTSAIAAYGAYLIPTIFATQIKAGTPEYALYAFAVYYASCLAVNWWFYARKHAEITC
jgi:MFS transporter, NNP family, nitrate/nitrite transporter